MRLTVRPSNRSSPSPAIVAGGSWSEGPWVQSRTAGAWITKRAFRGQSIGCNLTLHRDVELHSAPANAGRNCVPHTCSRSRHALRQEGLCRV